MSARPLAEVLGLARDEIVAAIGGGGKMTLLLSLGLEWARAGGRPLLLPTTRLHLPAGVEIPGLTTLALPAARSAWPRPTMPTRQMLLVGRRGARPDLLDPILDEEIPGLVEATGADLVLLKADGARGRSLKAHRDGEPVIPLETSLVVALAGLDVWGEELSEESVHRPELFSERWNHPPGQRLEDEAFLHALGDPEGYRAAVPAGVRYLVFLNQADRPVRVAIAQRLAARLHELGVDEVVWGDVRRLEWTLTRRGAR